MSLSRKFQNFRPLYFSVVKFSFYLFLFYYLFIYSFYFSLYLFLAVLALCCCSWAFSSCGVRASHCGGFSPCSTQAHGLQSAGLSVVAHGLSCPKACGIFLDHGSNWCRLHYKADSFFFFFLQGRFLTSTTREALHFLKCIFFFLFLLLS